MTLGELAVRFGCELRGDPAAIVDSVAALSQAGPRSVSFLANPKYVSQLAETSAGVVILDGKSAAGISVLITSGGPGTFVNKTDASGHYRLPAELRKSNVVAVSDPN